MMERILVIKLGAFGDFIQTLGPMAAIRQHHPDADITLLTTAPFVSLAQTSGYFNKVMIDPRARWHEIKKIIRLGRQLRKGGFKRVYDLQNNDRTAFYLWLFGINRPEWVGAAHGASHRNANPERVAGPAFEGHVQTLRLAGINNVRIDDLSWVRGDACHFGLPHPYVLLVPGSAPDHPEKRWPAESFGYLARRLYDWGYMPVILGTLSEKDVAATIQKCCPQATNLCGQTSITDLVLLARNAAGAIGNDTGPMHVIGPTGCPTLALFSSFSNPKRHAPIGPRVRRILQSDDVLSQITVADFRHKGNVNAA